MSALSRHNNRLQQSQLHCAVEHGRSQLAIAYSNKYVIKLCYGMKDQISLQRRRAALFETASRSVCSILPFN